MDVAARLIALREARGYTTNRLANLAGVSQSFVRDIERRAKRPTVETLSLLCDALGVSLRDFLTSPALRRGRMPSCGASGGSPPGSRRLCSTFWTPWSGRGRPL